MTEETVQADVAIIGAGPSGLFAVFECGMLGLTCAVFDSLSDIGGQCTALYPEKPIYDIPGCPAIFAGDLIANLEKQAAPFRPDYYLGQQVTGLSRDGQQWILTTSKGAKARVSAVIIAAEKTVSYETVVKAMDALQRAGVQRVGLSVRQGNH